MMNEPKKFLDNYVFFVPVAPYFGWAIPRGIRWKILSDSESGARLATVILISRQVPWHYVVGEPVGLNPSEPAIQAIPFRTKASKEIREGLWVKLGIKLLHGKLTDPIAEIDFSEIERRILAMRAERR